MDKRSHKISCILLAHNEGLNIAKVLDVLTIIPEFDEVILVADACTDDTVAIAKNYPNLRILERQQTKGKGEAMIFGVNNASGDIIMFCDADIKNFSAKHVYQILEPVVADQVVMSVGRRDRVLGLGSLIPLFFPQYAIAGERALTKEFFNSLPQDEHMMDFGIELVMNHYVKKRGLKLALPKLKNLHQIVKEKKWHPWVGFKARIDEMKQIMRTRIALRKRKNI